MLQNIGVSLEKEPSLTQTGSFAAAAAAAAAAAVNVLFITVNAFIVLVESPLKEKVKGSSGTGLCSSCSKALMQLALG